MFDEVTNVQDKLLLPYAELYRWIEWQDELICVNLQNTEVCGSNNGSTDVFKTTW